MRVVTAMGRVHVQLNRYSAEALTSLCHTVRKDEQDGRCAAQARMHPYGCGRHAYPWQRW